MMSVASQKSLTVISSRSIGFLVPLLWHGSRKKLMVNRGFDIVKYEKIIHSETYRLGTWYLDPNGTTWTSPRVIEDVSGASRD